MDTRDGVGPCSPDGGPSAGDQSDEEHELALPTRLPRSIVPLGHICIMHWSAGCLRGASRREVPGLQDRHASPPLGTGASGRRHPRVHVLRRPRRSDRIQAALPAPTLRSCARAGTLTLYLERDHVIADEQEPLPFSPMALGVYRSTGDVVGRPAELQAISQELATARAGRLAGLTVEGEPGIGKTRLLVEERL